MSNKLYVGKLAWETDSTKLEEAFAKYGEITEAKVIIDRDTGRSRGFGFVTFANTEDAQRALEMDGQELDGRVIGVSVARENRGGPGGGGGGGGRRGGGGGGRFDRHGGGGGGGGRR